MAKTYRVKKGDNLTSVAKKYNLTTQTLLRANPYSTPLTAGQSLKIPTTKVLASPAPGIIRGETPGLQTTGASYGGYPTLGQSLANTVTTPLAGALKTVSSLPIYGTKMQPLSAYEKRKPITVQPDMNAAWNRPYQYGPRKGTPTGGLPPDMRGTLNPSKAMYRGQDFGVSRIVEALKIQDVPDQVTPFQAQVLDMMGLSGYYDPKTGTLNPAVVAEQQKQAAQQATSPNGPGSTLGGGYGTYVSKTTGQNLGTYGQALNSAESSEVQGGRAVKGGAVEVAYYGANGNKWAFDKKTGLTRSVAKNKRTGKHDSEGAAQSLGYNAPAPAPSVVPTTPVVLSSYGLVDFNVGAG